MISHVKIVILTHIVEIRRLKVKYIVNLWIKDTSIQGTKCRVPLCPLKRGSTVATNASWLKLWDLALDHGPHGTNCLQALYRELTRPQFQKGVCHLCDTIFNSPYFHHYILSHTRLSNPELLISSLSSADLDIFMCGHF